jgi:hypothetical protein
MKNPVEVPLSLLKRLLPLVIEGNNQAIEGTAFDSDLFSDSDAEMDLERLIAQASKKYGLSEKE